MPPRRSLPPDAELAVKGHVEPVLINGGQTIKSLSAVFLADLERHWRVHGPKVLDVLAEKYPQAYFSGLVALSKVIKWDAGEGAMFDQTLTPEEIMDKLEQRVGLEGRKLFERFLRDVNELGRNGNWRRRHGWVSPNPQVNGRRFSRQPL